MTIQIHNITTEEDRKNLPLEAELYMQVMLDICEMLRTLYPTIGAGGVTSIIASSYASLIASLPMTTEDKLCIIEENHKHFVNYLKTQQVQQSTNGAN